MSSKKTTPITVGKRIGQAVYVHRSAIGHLDEVAKENIGLARAFLPADFQWSVLKVAGKKAEIISFLDYQDFSLSAFPELRRSCLVNLSNGSFKRLNYSKTNPPILHRKELLLAPDDPLRGEFSKITNSLEKKGLFKDMVRMGTRTPWSEALAVSGLKVDGASVFETYPGPTEEKPVNSVRTTGFKTSKVDRHKTAITRAALSAPMYHLFANGLINSETTVLDFGCGQGDDLNALKSAGYDIDGWDPHFRPEVSALKKSHITNLGFVLNVIEDPKERSEALMRSYSLTSRCLAVSVMLYGKTDLSGTRPYRDGYLTSRNTFQKYYTQSELRDYIRDVLEVEPLAVGQGIFLVFRDELDEQRYLLRLQTGFSGLATGSSPRSPPQRINISTKSLDGKSRAIVDKMATHIQALGRQPDVSELPKSLLSSLEKSDLVLQHAASLALANIGPSDLENIVEKRTEELSLHFAMHAFSQRKAYRSFPPELKRDIRAFFGSHKRAQDAGRALLFSIGSQERLLEDAETATLSGIGHLEDGKFQFHVNNLPDLSVRLRGYVLLAERLAGGLSETTLVRIHVNSRKLTALTYPDFETAVLPRLQTRIKVQFDTFDVSIVNHVAESDVRLLYLKSRYMPKIHPERDAQKAFDQEILDLNAFDFTNEGPRFRDFAQTLLKAGVKIPK